MINIFLIFGFFIWDYFCFFFKIFLFEKNLKIGNCKYGTLCTFAHGDSEIRTKNQNNMSGMGNNQNMSMMNQMVPGYFPPMDPNMYSMGMGMGFPNQMNSGKFYFLFKKWK